MTTTPTDMLEKVARAIVGELQYPDSCMVNQICDHPPCPCATKAAQAALDAIAESHVVVPREPTEAMIDAWCDLVVSRIKRRMKDDNDCPGIREGARESYKAMLSASQETSDG